MTLHFENESGISFDFPCETLAKEIVEAALEEEGFPYEGEVELLLVTKEEIKSINREQRQIDKETDVLSFPMLEFPGPGDFSRLEEDMDNFNPDTGEALLGDIVLNGERVKEQALLYGHSEKREYCFLILHSVLHLLGYDHMTEPEAAVMEEKQSHILQNMQILR